MTPFRSTACNLAGGAVGLGLTLLKLTAMVTRVLLMPKLVGLLKTFVYFGIQFVA